MVRIMYSHRLKCILMVNEVILLARIIVMLTKYNSDGEIYTLPARIFGFPLG